MPSAPSASEPLHRTRPAVPGRLRAVSPGGGSSQKHPGASGAAQRQGWGRERTFTSSCQVSVTFPHAGHGPHLQVRTWRGRGPARATQAADRDPPHSRLTRSASARPRVPRLPDCGNLDPDLTACSLSFPTAARTLPLRGCERAHGAGTVKCLRSRIPEVF